METDKVIIHGVEYVPKVVIVPEPAKFGRWKPEEDEKYYLSDEYGNIVYSRWEHNSRKHTDRIEMGNCYQTYELAVRARDRQLLLVELQDYADQKNAGEEMTEQCYSLAKFGNNWGWVDAICVIPGTVRFRDRVDASAAIDHFGDRLDLLL